MHGSGNRSGRRVPIHRPAIGAVGIALVLNACGTVSTGPQSGTRTLSVGSTIAGAAAIEFTNEASVRDTTVMADPRIVWARLPGVFATLGIEPTTQDAPAGVMGNDAFEGPRIEDRPMSRYIDCGSTFGGARADVYRVRMFFLVQLEVPAAGQTKLTLVLDSSARPREVSGNAVHCASLGTLERRFLALLSEALPSG